MGQVRIPRVDKTGGISENRLHTGAQGGDDEKRGCPTAGDMVGRIPPPLRVPDVPCMGGRALCLSTFDGSTPLSLQRRSFPMYRITM